MLCWIPLDLTQHLFSAGHIVPYDLCMHRSIFHPTHSPIHNLPLIPTSAVWRQELSGSPGLCLPSSSVPAFSLPSYPSRNLESLEAIQMFPSSGDISLVSSSEQVIFLFLEDHEQMKPDMPLPVCDGHIRALSPGWRWAELLRLDPVQSS